MIRLDQLVSLPAGIGAASGRGREAYVNTAARCARHRAGRPSVWQAGRLSVFALLLLAALLTLLPGMALAVDPVTWSVTESKYGAAPGSAPDTAFQVVPAPFPNIGMTAGANKAYGMGIWQDAQSVYVFGLTNTPVMTGAAPTMAETDLAGKDIGAGTLLELKFAKTADQRINYFAFTCDTEARITVEPEAGKTLTEASYFVVKATIVRPVKSASGELAGGAFGFMANLSSAADQDYLGAVFATNMHWDDVKPPTISSSGMAGLNAAGFNGVSATFDGVFPSDLLTKMGITDPANVQGYIDASRILPTSTAAAFAYKGIGDGSLWNAGWYKYRITNSAWSTHNILYGRAVKPAKPVAKSPKGTIATAKPTFRWSKAAGATKYEIRVYKGTKKLFGKAGLPVTSLKCSKALPRGVSLTWKVRAGNSAGWSGWASLKFKVR
jgi:hypothetical protein